MEDKRLPTVPVDSSAARMPFPGATMARAVATSSSAYLLANELPATGRGRASSETERKGAERGLDEDNEDHEDNRDHEDNHSRNFASKNESDAAEKTRARQRQTVAVNHRDQK